jgi:hypothetical protein
MDSKSKLSSRPPVKSVEDFIAEADRRPGDQPQTPPEPAARPVPPFEAAAGEHSVSAARRRGLPWDRPSVRDDVKKTYVLRLPEAYLLKLKFIAENTPDSMQKFCLGQLLPAIDKKVNELLAKAS